MNILPVEITEVDAGQNVTIIEPCNIYRCKLGDNVFVALLQRFKTM